MMVLARARMILSALGLVIRREDGEYRVNFQGGVEATAYYTDDLDDAVETGQAMADQAEQVTEFDYDLQVWTVGGIIQDCGHLSAPYICKCNARKYRGLTLTAARAGR